MEYVQAPLMAVDALGRKTPGARECGGVRPNRLVGMFYFLWCGEEGRHAPYDISRILREDPMAGYRPDSDVWGEEGVYHHWGKPFYGYYYSDDEWVVRRHMRLLAQAGVDFLFFDTTNANIYEKNAKLVMRVLQEYHDSGMCVPRVLFYTNTDSGKTAEEIYRKIYQPGFCKDVWFSLEGKPVIIAKPEECSSEVRGFFDIKLSQWPNEPDKLGGWPWMDFVRPQRYFCNLKGEKEVINVSVAQHPQVRFGDSALYGEEENRGRSFHHGSGDNSPLAYLYGYNFEEQWERAVQVDAPIVLVTGWNEWIAGRWHGTEKRPLLFVDCADCEYSRDIEMMEGGYFDNYYMQLISWIRRYKGAPEAKTVGCGELVKFPHFRDGTFSRDHDGFDRRYKNYTQRNAICGLEVSHTNESLRLCIRCAGALKPADGRGDWMKLFVSVKKEKDGGYEFVINNTPSQDGITTVAAVDHGLACHDIARIPYRTDADSITFDVPLSVLGITGIDDTLELWLKAADALRRYEKIEDFYDNGDVAPTGRLNYVYKLGKLSPAPSKAAGSVD